MANAVRGSYQIISIDVCAKNEKFIFSIFRTFNRALFSTLERGTSRSGGDLQFCIPIGLRV